MPETNNRIRISSSKVFPKLADNMINGLPNKNNNRGGIIMLKKVSFLTVCCLGGLSGCASMYQPTYYSESTSYQPYVYQNTQFYPRQDRSINYAGEENTTKDSYYVGAYRSPTSHKDLDRNWVNSQNPNSYTIEIGVSEKASQVANKLHKMPKNDRMAEIKAYRDGKYYYKGVYGTYSNYNDAQKALNHLPPELRQGATIKNWRSVQD